MFKLTMPALPVETPHVLFDISRLYRSRSRQFATGIDRIDLAIGLNLLRQFRKNCHFLHAGPLGSAILPHRLGAALLIHLDANWNRGKNRTLPRPLKAEPILRSFLPDGRAEIVNAATTY